MTPENEVPTEDALFDTAVDGSPEPAAPPPAPDPDPAPVEQRTEQTTQPDATAAKPDAVIEGSPADDETEMVPRSRIRGLDKEKRAAEAERDAVLKERDALRRERDRIDYERQEYQRRLNAAQPKPETAEPEAPDPLLDPKGYREYMEKRWEDRLTAERREFSLQSARKVYREEFDQAYRAAQQLVDPALQARMQRSADPGETLIAWFRELKVRAEVGNDPAAYRKRIEEEQRKALLADPEFRKTAMETWRDGAPAQTNGRPNVQLAPSLNGVSRSSAALRASQQDLSDDALWETTTT